MDLEKQGGPYLQYSFARASNILKKCNFKNIYLNCYKNNKLTFRYYQIQEISLVKKLSQLSYIIELCSINLKPNILASYALELADLFNQFYRYIPVINSEDDSLKINRIYLVESFRVVFSIVLDMLGIDALEEM